MPALSFMNPRAILRMLPLFNLVRLGVYISVLAWTLIVLGIASYFQHILIPSDLTRFVPFAILVASITILVIPILLFVGTSNPKKKVLLLSQTRYELLLLGIVGVFWVSLAAYLSAAELADVDCGDGDDGVDDEALPTYTSEQYHAQYHVLQAFSIFNTILIVGFLFFVLFMALRHHFTNRKQVWTSRSTTYPWNSAPQPPPKLPLPVTSKGKGKQTSSAKPTTHTRAPPPPKPFSRTAPPKPAPPPRAPAVQPPQMSQKPSGKGKTYVVYIPPNQTRSGARQQYQVYPPRRP